MFLLISVALLLFCFFCGLALIIYIAFRLLRRRRVGRDVFVDLPVSFFSRLRQQYAAALPHETPVYPDVVDALALIPRSEMRQLAMSWGSAEERQPSLPLDVEPQPALAEPEETECVEDIEGREERVDFKLSSFSSHISLCSTHTTEKGQSVLFFPVHLRKAASIHGRNSFFRESVTLLRRVSSCVFFGRADYTQWEGERKDCNVEFELPGAVTIFSESGSTVFDSLARVKGTG